MYNCTLTYTNTSMQAQEITTSFSETFSFDASFNEGVNFIFKGTLTEELKASYMLTWTTDYQKSITNTTMSTSALSVQGPPCGNATAGQGPCVPVYDAEGNQPTQFEVYQDNLYGTFMFAPVNYSGSYTQPTIGPTFEQVTGTTPSSTPTPLTFKGGSGSTIAAQILQLTLNAGTSSATITPATTDGGNWLLICSGSCTPTSSAPLTGVSLTTGISNFTLGVSPNLTAVITYSGCITVSGMDSTSLVIPVTFTVTGVHPTGVGIFRASNGAWLENTQFNNVFTSGDLVTLFAGNGLTPTSTDIAVTGDWNGDGVTKIGLYRPSTGTWYLDYNGNGVYDGPNVDRQYQYGGLQGDIPVVGDWTGTGYSKIGLFRSGFLFLLNLAGNGTFSGGSNDAVFPFGGLTGCFSGLPGYYSMEPAGS